jgi:hypothetical protein
LDGAKVTVEQAKGAATHILKDAIFNRRDGVASRPENENENENEADAMR